MSLRTCGTKDLDGELSQLNSGYIHFKTEWCPDCIRSNAVVREALAAAGQPLLVVDVGERSDWKTPDAPLRKDPRFRLSGLPTLVRWQDGKVTARLEKPLENAASPAEALKAVAEFVAQK